MDRNQIIISMALGAVGGYLIGKNHQRKQDEELFQKACTVYEHSTALVSHAMWVGDTVLDGEFDPDKFRKEFNERMAFVDVITNSYTK